MAIWYRRSRPSQAGITRKVRRSVRKQEQQAGLLRRAEIEQFEPRHLMAVSPQLISIIPSAGDLLNLNGTEVRNQEFRELTFRFDEGQRIDEASVRAGGIQIIRAGGDGVFGNGNEVDVTPNVLAKNGFVGLGDRPNEVVVRFSDHLPDDLYQIRIVGGGATPLLNEEQLPFNNGSDQTVRFELDLGPQVIAVVPQPIRRVAGQLQQARNEIEVYFNNDDLNQAAATNPTFYQLVRTRGTADNLDNGPAILPSSVIYDPAADRARLIFATDLATLDTTETVYRLRIGNQYTEPLAPMVRTAQQLGDAGDTLSTALNVGQQTGTPALGSRTIVLQGEIEAKPYGLTLPGGIDEPGHRQLPEGLDVPHVGDGDATNGVTTVFYNFQLDYGTDPQGNQLRNLITEAQKQRAREVFEYYSRYLGVQFIETADQGVTVVTGDLRVLDPTVPTGPGGVAGLGGPGMVIMDNAENWNSDPGGSWFTTAMHELGHALGLGHTYDLPPGTIMGDDPSQGGGNDPSYPGDNDIVHGRYLYRPESIDIDAYRIRLDQAGILSAETVAERLGDSSLLDSVIWVYSSTGDLIARNDDYYSEDSFVELNLQPGDYYIAVTSTGMSEPDLNLAGSAFGGTTQGRYDLRLNFKPNPERTPTAASGLVDIDGQPTLLDGDNDGAPGGDYNFWFSVAAAGNTLIVDKVAPNGGTGTLVSPMNSIQAAFNAATIRNSDADPANDVRVVRIAGNGGADGNLATLADNSAYEIGFNTLGQALSDGTDMQVPKGVTVMIDAGSIFKLRRATIDVGSRSQGVDRSLGHLQILGTPTQSVYFTSYHNETLGRDTFALPTTPSPGDWGGIVFRNELDYDAERPVLESEGIFINYVNHANFTFGGGESSIFPGASFSPIQLNESRPNISFNTVSNSAGAAMAGDPNSFRDDLFTDVGRDFVDGQVTIAGGIATLTGGVWPSWAGRGTLSIAGTALVLPVEARLSNTQLRLAGVVPDTAAAASFSLAHPRFTANYSRVGPEIYFNSLRDNSINGLFIQIETRGGEPLDKLEVPARFNDTDIVHVLSENLIIQGTPGGPQQTAFTGARNDARLDARLVIDPGTIVKLDRARIETEIGAQLIAEGRSNNRVIFTSILDDRFGGSGTFDTAGKDLGPFSLGTVSALNGVVTLLGGVWPTWAAGATLTVNGIDYSVSSRDSDTQITLTRTNVNFASSPFTLTKIFLPDEGNWGGLSFGPVSQGSIDHALITFGGGITTVEGGFASYSAVEIQQADVRLTNSVLENNANGRASGRGAGRFNNDSAVIYVRAAQPVIVNNIIRNNAPGDDNAAISINVNALNSELVHDTGRSTGNLERTGDFVGNSGPLVRNNKLGGNGINGMLVRGSTLTTQSVWDDTDIVHVLRSEVVVQNHHTFSGVRLQSGPTESLVVKLQTPAAPSTDVAGFTANGVPIDINDRIGGTVQVIGTPGHPVVLTSVFDSTVGAGLDPEGRPQNDTVAGAQAPETAITRTKIEFRIDPQLATNTALVNALERAAAKWEAYLDDPITIVFDVTSAGVAGALGTGQAVFETRSYDEVRQLIINDAKADEAIVKQLPTFAQLQAQFPDDTYVLSPTMSLARANLLALGVDPSQLTARPSQYDPLTLIDGVLTFDQNATFDFDPNDGIAQGAFDFVSTAAHEIGHALGFFSAVDDVDAGVKTVEMNTLDLFRLAPGEGANDFTNAPRLLDPTAPNHVFYDGGIYRRADVTVPPLNIGEIPMSTGTTTGDGRQASHWKEAAQLGLATEIGLMGPTIFNGAQAPITLADRRAFGLIGYDVVSRGDAGDWRSIKFERYSNDRNVATIVERESGEQNSTPEVAQPLGQLARSEQFNPLTEQPGGGDELRRLGFEIHGAITTNSDADVYTFIGVAGSEVWLDIDRTGASLDSIVELIDAAGNVIARSNDSTQETQGLQSIFRADPSIQAFPMQRDVFSSFDLYTTNPRDAGLRMILPGPLNTAQKYFVRVRSNSANLANVAGGQTKGEYQLQIRLREVDEIPGSTVVHADIRYAINGIEVLGAPGHSPLLGEATEITGDNDTLPNAQDLGNLLVQDRGALSLSGALATWDDIDWYKVVVDWTGIQKIQPTVGTRDDDTASLIFDMDYADGTGRPDTNFAIFDDQGRLLYFSPNSNIDDDQVPQGIGSGLNDLSRGSFGEFDPYMGPIHLPANANKTYFVAVSSNARIPEVISNEAAVRLEPLSAVRRVVDDRVGGSWTPPVLGDPPPPPGLLFDPLDLNAHADPWQLNDVTLYVLAGSQLMTVDPFTGQTDSLVGLTPGNAQQPLGYGDIAMRKDGRLFAFTRGVDDGSSGNYHELDWHGPAFGADPLDVPVNAIGDDGIAPSIGGQGTNQGVQFEAITFQGVGQTGTLWGVGVTDPAAPNENYLWEFFPDTGMARPDNNGTQIDPSEPAPRGPIDQTAMPPFVMPLDTAANGGPGGKITGIAIVNGLMYFVSERGGFFKQDDQGLLELITVVQDPMNRPIAFSGLTAGPENVEDFAYSQLMFATGADGKLYALNVDGELQPIFQDGAKSVTIPGLSDVRGLTFSTLDYNLWHVTQRRSQDAGHGLDPTPDRVRTRRIDGGQSFYFGLERNAGQLGAPNYDTNQAVFNTYDLPGGAHGALTTNPFSLEGYSFGDAPTLYFNYLVSHDTIVDSFRVFISDDGANWNFLAQTPLPPSPPFPVNDNGFDENLVNDGQWRQARLDLSPYYGRDNLRLRFEFSNEGGRRQGSPDVGEPLGALLGGELKDGDTFQLSQTLAPDSKNVTFEFDMGYSLEIPNGGAVTIPDGEQFKITGASGSITTFEFDRDGKSTAGAIALPITSTDSADTIIQTVEQAIMSAVDGNGMPLGVTPHVYQNRINLEGPLSVGQSANAIVVLSGSTGIGPMRTPVIVHAGMTRAEVARAMAEAIDKGMSAALKTMDDPNFFTSSKLIRESVQLIGHRVVDPGPLPYDAVFAPDFRGDPDPGSQNINEDAKGNNFEGVLLDDFVIGFVERGEMVLNSPADTDYTLPNPVPVGQVLSGAYQLEARRGTTYGIPVPPTLTDPPGFLLTRTFDTNHRFADSITFIAPDPREIHAGATFTIDDGVNRVTFEFDLSGQGVTPGNRPVLVNNALTAADVAAAIRDAVNAVTAPGANQPDALVTAADVAPPFLGLTSEVFHSPFVVLHRVAHFETDSAESGIVVDTMDSGSPAGISNAGTNLQKEFGDTNIVRDQGQLIIQNNSITNSSVYGIVVDAGARDAVTNLPHPGSVRNLQDFNTRRLAPSVSIVNNVVAYGRTGGILFSGDDTTDPLGAVPFGRIVNNTIFGGDTPTGIGINVGENASPTLLNNVVAGLNVGIQVDPSSASGTIIGGTVYHRNTTNTVGVGVGTFPMVVAAGEEIFVDPVNGNFIPSIGSKLIDSSINSLQDRPELTTLTAPLGFAPAPIIAPERDQLGQLRVNDPAVPSPPGLGADVFKDRGAVERGDFAGPSAALIDPVTGSPLDASVTNKNFLQTAPIDDIAIQLIDGVQPADPQFGSGIDDNSVINDRVFIDGIETPISRVTLIRDGVTLVEGLDYIFTYDTTNKVIHLRPTQGVWAANHIYRVLLNNSPVIGTRLDETPVTGIRDEAGNLLKPNNLQGTTEFTVTIDPVDFGDAPTPYPTQFIDNGAHHRLVGGPHLGATVTAEVNGQPSQNALSDTGDDGVTLPAEWVVGESRQITVTASAAARLDAWIDFNVDGDWDDAGEQIFTSRAVVAGANTFNVTIPSTAGFGESYARFRLSTAGGLAPTGLANDGEVEDYRIVIEPQASYTLQLRYDNGRELFRDLLNRYFVSPGLNIIAEVYVEDNRTIGPAGVRQAFADLAYDNDLIDFDPASLEYGPTFTSGRAGTVDEANQLIDEAGGMATVAPATPARQLLFRVHGVIKTDALAEQILTLSLNQADASPAHDTLLFNNNQPINASYESETIVVKANPWQNAASALDVNASGSITGLDALVIINRLNLQGPAVLPPPGGTVPTDNPPTPLYPQPFYDVNGDGRVTALDVLVVFNALNAGQGGSIVAAGEVNPAAASGTTASLTAAGDSTTTLPIVATPATLEQAAAPLASSFDVTPLAISAAGSGSTAVPIVLVADDRSSTLTASAKKQAFVLSDGDPSYGGLPVESTGVVDEVIAADDHWTLSELDLRHVPSAAAVAGITDSDAVFEAIGLAADRKKKFAVSC